MVTCDRRQHGNEANTEGLLLASDVLDEDKLIIQSCMHVCLPHLASVLPLRGSLDKSSPMQMCCY